MTSTHIIRSQHMELRFNNEAQAGVLHTRIADLCRTVVGEVIEACLKKHHIAGTILTVKKIDIDLGTITFRDIETELPERLYHYLDRELARIIFTADTATLTIAAPAAAALEALAYFLQHGYLPWNVTRRRADELIAECLDARTHDLAVMIRRSGQSAIVRRRMTQRFSNSTIAATIHALEPASGAAITGFHDHLMIVNTHLSIVEASRSTLERTLWLFIFNTLLVEQGSAFNAISFAKSVLHQFACHFNIAYDELIRLLRDGMLLWKGGLPSPYDGLLRQIVEMEPSEQPVTPGSAARSRHKTAAGAEALVRWLLTTPSRHPVPPQFGFDTYTAALQFTAVHHTSAISKQLAARDHTRSWAFFQKLNRVELDHIAGVGKHYASSWYAALFHAWAHRLRGFYKQQELMTELKRVLLWSFYLGLGPSDQRFLNKTRMTLNRYVLPASFIGADRSWLLPVKGDINEALEKIERELNRKMQPTSTRKRKLKTKIENETVQHEAEYLEKRTKPGPKTDATEPLFVANAGLTLLHPYFNYLFDQLGLLEQGRFKDDEAVATGVLLLHYAVSGIEEIREEDCVLNKVLCGHPVGKALHNALLTAHHKAFVDSMLDAFKSHWTVIADSSPDAVRGNWLVREGKLIETDKHWELFVERKPYDLLMASLPYTVSPVCFSWMNKVMIIHWL